MSYKSLKGKWQVAGDKPTITLLPAGMFCFNKVFYEQFVQPANCNYVKLYYDPEAKKIAFELLTDKSGEQVFPISLTQTGRVAVVKAKRFLDHFGIKYAGKPRSYTVHRAVMSRPGSGYKRTWSQVRLEVLEIRLDEYVAD